MFNRNQFLKKRFFINYIYDYFKKFKKITIVGIFNSIIIHPKLFYFWNLY